jgi:GAF domain-containing protein
LILRFRKPGHLPHLLQGSAPGSDFIFFSQYRFSLSDTVIVSDTDSDKRVEFKKELKKEGIKSMIVTPILARDKAIGVMRVYSADYTGFPSDVLVMIEALAHQGGLAIQNASMYLSLQEEKTSLEKDIWSHRSWF